MPRPQRKPRRQILSGRSYDVRLTSNVDCFDLVLVDSSRLRQEEQKKCQALYRKIEVAREKVEVHETMSVPAFQKWMHLEFGEKLSEIRESEAKLIRLEEIVHAVEMHSWETGASEHESYQQVMNARNRFEEIHSKYDQSRRGGRDGDKNQGPFESDFENHSDHQTDSEGFSGSGHSSKLNEEAYQEELLRAAFEMLAGPRDEWQSRKQTYEQAFNEFKQGILSEEKRREKRDHKRKQRQHENHQERKNQFHGSSQDEESEISDHPFVSKKSENTRIKEIYRQLARKLHPDLNPGLESKKIQLWHQVQEAYENQNLERLEALSALGEMYSGAWEKLDGISTLKNLFKELFSSFKQLEKKIRNLRKDVSWGFADKQSNQKAMNQLRNTLGQELSLTLSEATVRVEELEEIIEEWSAPRKRRARGNKSRGGQKFQGFQF